MMKDLKEQGKHNVGFVDPNIVFKDAKTSLLPNWYPDTVKNLYRFFHACRDKTSILFPYCFK